MSQETIEKTFSVSGPARLSLGNIRGSVDIQGAQDGQIHVTAVKHLNSGNAERTTIEITQSEDGSVHVKTGDQNGRQFFSLSKPCRVDYTVRLPRACQVNASGVSCTILLKGIEGETHISSVSGAITIEDLNGPIQVNTVSGEVSGERIYGTIHLDTVSGAVHMNDSNLSSAVCSSVSGDMVLQTPLGEGPYKFNSVSGNAGLIVPVNTHCDVKISSLSGRFRTSLPITSNRERTGSHTMEVQGGGVLVSLHSTSGNLFIEKPEGEEPPTPASELHTLTPTEILDRIERGELSVEDGIKAIRAGEEQKKPLK